METKKALMGIICLVAVIGCIAVLCVKGVTLHHKMPGKQEITIPESKHAIEFRLGKSREPIRINIRTPKQKIKIETPET